MLNWDTLQQVVLKVKLSPGTQNMQDMTAVTESRLPFRMPIRVAEDMMPIRVAEGMMQAH
jgi:hypothetical protein